MNDVKAEKPNVIVVNCDPINFGDAAVKNELKEESVPFEKSSVLSNNNDDFNNDDGDEAASLPSYKSIAPSFVTKKDITTSNSIDHLIADYIEMTCEICQHPFKTLKRARGHLRGIHKLRSIKVKCCQKKVDLYDISGHIQSHLNPEIYK